MAIVIPMAGLSSRFFEAGYSVPKYMLELHGRTLFDWSLLSFKSREPSEKFVVILRDVFDTLAFVEQRLRALSIDDCELVVLSSETRGQAETVMFGLEEAKLPSLEPITVFNIDTIRPNYRFPSGEEYKTCDGYLEVFEGEGDHWSFALSQQDNSTKVRETAEKVRISNLCSTGLYYFSKQSHFVESFENLKNGSSGKELYVAPMYNHMISKNLDIRYHLIGKKDVLFSGVPEEFEALKTSDRLQQAIQNT